MYLQRQNSYFGSSNAGLSEETLDKTSWVIHIDIIEETD